MSQLHSVSRFHEDEFIYFHTESEENGETCEPSMRHYSQYTLVEMLRSDHLPNNPGMYPSAFTMVWSQGSTRTKQRVNHCSFTVLG
jgi:hypothetical protein